MAQALAIVAPDRLPRIFASVEDALPHVSMIR